MSMTTKLVLVKRDRDLVEQEDCGKFASQQPGRNSISKINKEELFQVCNHFMKVELLKLIKGNCTLENNFGFETGNPCILLKVNRIYGWEPLPYESTTEKERLPEEVPEAIKNKIIEYAGKEETKALVSIEIFHWANQDFVLDCKF